VGRPRNRWEDVIQRDAVNLLRIRNWKAAARDKGEWRKKVGEAMARKRAEAPWKKKRPEIQLMAAQQWSRRVPILAQQRDLELHQCKNDLGLFPLDNNDLGSYYCYNDVIRNNDFGSH
jgi:hypothetical protein